MKKNRRKYLNYVVNDIKEKHIETNILVKKGANRFVQEDYYTNRVFDTTFNDVRAFFGGANEYTTRVEITKRYGIEVRGEDMSFIITHLKTYSRRLYQHNIDNIKNIVLSNVDFNSVHFSERGVDTYTRKRVVKSIRQMGVQLDWVVEEQIANDIVSEMTRIHKNKKGPVQNFCFDVYE